MIPSSLTSGDGGKKGYSRALEVGDDDDEFKPIFMGTATAPEQQEPGFVGWLSHQWHHNRKLFWGGAALIVLAVIVIVAIAESMAPKDGPSGPEGGPQASFLVIGDWGRMGAWLAGSTRDADGAARQARLAPDLAAAAARYNAALIVSSGDNFYENGLASAADAAFNASFSALYSDPRLRLPWQLVLGNHDYRGDVLCQLGSELPKRDPRWHQSAFVTNRRLPFGSPDGPGGVLELFFIDTSPFMLEYQQHPGPDLDHTRGWGDDVYDWRGMAAEGGPRGRAVGTLRALRSALAVSTATWKVVVGHHPVRSNAGHGDSEELLSSPAGVFLPVGEGMLPGGGQLMLDGVLWEGGVHAYMNGHDHNLQHIVRPACCAMGEKAAGPSAFAAMRGRPMHYVTTGAGSALDPSLRPGPSVRFGDDRRNGFVAVKATPRALFFDFVVEGGRVAYSFRVDP